MPSLRPRFPSLLLAAAAAAVAALVVAAYAGRAPFGAADVDQIWWAARALLNGDDPYVTIRSSGFPFLLYYPLTSALVALPIGFVAVEPARIVIIVGGAALFGFAIGRSRRYLWPTLFGLPFLVSARSGQWAPILTAAMVMPSLGWLAAAKPNIGVAMLAGARTLRQAAILVGGSAALVLLSLVVDPRWPWKWAEALAGSTHFAPLLVRPGGVVMLAALFCWGDADARLLLGLALVPQTGFFYDTLPACLVARSRRQAAALALTTHVATLTRGFFPEPHGFTDQAWQYGTISLWLGLVPALVLVLGRHLDPVHIRAVASRFLGSSRSHPPGKRKDEA